MWLCAFKVSGINSQYYYKKLIQSESSFHQTRELHFFQISSNLADQLCLKAREYLHKSVKLTYFNKVSLHDKNMNMNEYEEICL